MLNEIMVECCKVAEVSTLNVPECFFYRGVEEVGIPDSTFDGLPKWGFLLHGYRFLPPFLRSPDLSAHKKVILVRDPRDIMVSLYFSNAHSHVLPPEGELRDAMLAKRKELQETPIGEYSLGVDGEFIRDNFDLYAGLLDANSLVIHYEDLVYEKLRVVGSILDYLNISIPQSRLEEIVAKQDLFPEQEDISEHVRQVHPGNFTNHFDQQRVAQLNDYFRDACASFGYAALAPMRQCVDRARAKGLEGHLAVDGVELPQSGNALEFVAAAIGEAQLRAGNQVLHGARYEYFVGTRSSAHSGAEMDGEARHLVAEQLTLARVEARPD